MGKEKGTTTGEKKDVEKLKKQGESINREKPKEQQEEKEYDKQVELLIRAIKNNDVSEFKTLINTNQDLLYMHDNNDRNIIDLIIEYHSDNDSKKDYSKMVECLVKFGVPSTSYVVHKSAVAYAEFRNTKKDKNKIITLLKQVEKNELQKLIQHSIDQAAHNQQSKESKNVSAGEFNNRDFYWAVVAHLKKINSPALADTWADGPQVIDYLNFKLKNKNNIAIPKSAWTLSYKREGFPWVDFVEFLSDKSKTQFVLPLVGTQHFCGLIVRKDEKGLLKFEYFNPTAKKAVSFTGGDVENVNKFKEFMFDIAKVILEASNKQKESDSIEFILNDVKMTVDKETVKNIANQFGSMNDSSEINVSNTSSQRQFNGSDCGYITGQTLVDTVLGSEITVPSYVDSDLTEYARGIAQARANFFDSYASEEERKELIIERYLWRIAKAIGSNFSEAQSLRKLISLIPKLNNEHDAIFQILKEIIKEVEEKIATAKNIGNIPGDIVVTIKSRLKGYSPEQIENFCNMLLQIDFLKSGDPIFIANIELLKHLPSEIKQQFPELESQAASRNVKTKQQLPELKSQLPVEHRRREEQIYRRETPKEIFEEIPKKVQEEFLTKIRKESFEKLTEYIKKYPNIVNIAQAEGQTALHIAVHTGDIKLVTFLLANNAFVSIEAIEIAQIQIANNENNPKERTIFVTIAEMLDAKMAEELSMREEEVEEIERKQPPEKEKKKGSEFYQLKKRVPEGKIPSEIIEKFFTAVHENDLSKVGSYLEQYPQLVDTPDKDRQQTALHKAARDGKVELVKLLLNAGAATDEKDYKDRTAIVLAGDSKGKRGGEIIKLIEEEKQRRREEGKKEEVDIDIPAVSSEQRHRRGEPESRGKSVVKKEQEKSKRDRDPEDRNIEEENEPPRKKMKEPPLPSSRFSSRPMPLSKTSARGSQGQKNKAQEPFKGPYRTTENYSRQVEDVREQAELIRKDPKILKEKEHFRALGAYSTRDDFYFEEANVKDEYTESFFEVFFVTDKYSKDNKDVVNRALAFKGKTSSSQAKSCLSFIHITIHGQHVCLIALSGYNPEYPKEAPKLWRYLANFTRDFNSSWAETGKKPCEFIFLRDEGANFNRLLARTGEVVSQETESRVALNAAMICAEKKFVAVLSKLFYKFGSDVQVLGVANAVFDPDYTPRNGVKLIPCCTACTANKGAVMAQLMTAVDVGNSKDPRTNFPSPFKEAQLQDLINDIMREIRAEERKETSTRRSMEESERQAMTDIEPVRPVESKFMSQRGESRLSRSTTSEHEEKEKSKKVDRKTDVVRSEKKEESRKRERDQESYRSLRSGAQGFYKNEAFEEKKREVKKIKTEQKQERPREDSKPSGTVPKGKTI